MQPTSSRRTALRSFSLLALLAVANLGSAAAPREVPIAFIGPADGDAWRGARQGLAEANTQGRFLGLHYELVTAATAQAAQAQGAVAIVAAVPAPRLLELAQEVPELAVVNVSAEDDALRERCSPNLLHTIPSAAMRADALQQWQRKAPQSQASARAWHADFKKYAAAQLNRRYSDGAGQAMSDTAWAAWAAVKVIADSLAQQPAADAGALLGALRRDDLAFDGQKGADLSFRATGQLRQPLLLVEAGHIVGEAPVRGIVDADDLDSLGRATCPE